MARYRQNWVVCQPRQVGLGGNDLDGEIPSELGSLSRLVEFVLVDNDLSGEIPSELGNLSSLEELDLGGNQLNGEIPAELGNLADLKYLNLTWNQLSGEIPAELGRLNNLSLLALGGNQLSGEIPSELGNLSNLTELYHLGIQRAESGEWENTVGIEQFVELESAIPVSQPIERRVPSELGSPNQFDQTRIGPQPTERSDTIRNRQPC